MDKRFSTAVLLISILILTQYNFYLSIVTLSLWVPYSILLYAKGDSYPALITLLISGFLNDGIFNLSTIRVGNASLLYIYIAIIFLIAVISKKRLLFERPFVFLLLYVFTTLFFSIYPNPINSFFYRDLAIYLFVPVFFITFRFVEVWAFLRLALAVGTSRLLAGNFYYFTEIGMQEMNSYIVDFVVPNYDEMSILYISVALSLASLKKNLYPQSVIYILIFAASIAFFGINVAGVGSQSILVVFFVLLLCFFYRLYFFNLHSLNLSLLILLSTIVALFSSDLFYIDAADYLYFKLNNITASLLYFNDLSSIPYSVQVRIVETLNIIDRPFFANLIGGGFGSNFSDHIVPFSYLGTDAFTLGEIEDRVFYMPHNFNYWFLKSGMLMTAFFVWLSYRLAHKNYCGPSFIVLSPLVLVLFFNFGYGYKYSLLLALVMVFACSKVPRPVFAVR